MSGARYFSLGAGLAGSTSGPPQPTLVLLPGIGCDARVWLNQVPLAERADLRGVLAVGLPDADRLVDMGAELLRSLPAGPLVVVGASLGGLVGWAMAGLAPRRVVALATVNTLPARRLCPAGLARQRALLGLVPRSVRRALYRRRIGSRLVAEGVQRWVVEALLGGLPGPQQLGRRLDAVLGWGLVAPVPVPALWLRGQVDGEAPWTVSDLMRELPEVRHQVVPGAHRPHLSHPGAFNHALGQWLNELSCGGPRPVAAGA